MTGVLARFERPTRAPAEARGRRLDLYLCVAVAAAALALYVRTLAPGVLDGDSGEWQYVASILGVPHSTGYPLYILLAKVATLLPEGNAAWRVNLFSAVCAALAVPVVFLLARRVSHSHLAALLAASFFTVMPTLWASATIAEVYALNTLLLGVVLLFAARFLDHRRARDLYAMAFCFGLALDNHRVAFFVAPALLLIVWLARSVLDMRKLGFAVLALLLPLTLYAYIPVRASQLLAVQSPANWELYPRAEAIVNGKVTAYYNPTPEGVLNLITALDNRNKLGFADATGENRLATRLENAWDLLREQVDPFGLGLALLGAVVVWRRERPLALMLLVAAAGIAGVSLVLRAESTRFYFSGAYLVLALFLAAAFQWSLGMVQDRVKTTAGRAGLPLRALYAALIAYFALFPLSALVLNFPRMDRSTDRNSEVYARAVLGDQLAPDAVLVAPWEVATPVRYFQYVEGIRPDVLTIHESPVRPQYQKIMEAAHRLHRPFYYAQFTPEDKNTPAPRTVQAVAFPLPQKIEPQHAMDVRLNEGIRVVGYDWTPDLGQPASAHFARLAVYYEVLKPVTHEYIAELDFGTIRGESLGSWTRRPVSEYYPTYLWQVGEVYRDVWDIPISPDFPRGLYNAQLTWAEFDSARNTADEATAREVRVEALPLGELDKGEPANLQPTEFEDGIRLVGYSFDPSAGGGGAIAAGPGGPFRVTICWLASQPVKPRLTFFVHLTDEAGVVRAQADQEPLAGMYPTDRWPVNTPVCDHYVLAPAHAIAPGSYRLEVGLYTNPEAPRLVRVQGSSETRVILDRPVTIKDMP